MKRPPRSALALLLAGCAATPPPHLVDDLAPIAPRGRVNVVVEIPAGTLAKWEVDKGSGRLEWEWEEGVPRVVRYLAYPGNYGMVPRTLLPEEDGGDGDPLDVLILGASAERGAVVQVTLIGVLELLDANERDDKLIAVTDGSPFESLASIQELDEQFPGVTTIVRTWFERYKGVDGDGQPIVRAEGFAGPERAREILDGSLQAYVEHWGDPKAEDRSRSQLLVD